MNSLKYPALFFAYLLLWTRGEAQEIVDMRDPARAYDYAFEDIDTIYRSRNEFSAMPWTIKSVVVFQGDTFLKGADFNFINFQQDADFNWSYFGEEADFIEDTFCSNADFARTTFHSGVNFSQAVFKRTFSAGKVIFDNVDFSMACFQKVDLTDATFRGPALFSRATFCKATDFRDVKFRSTADFSGATFLSTADFSHLELSDSSRLVFNAARLPPAHVMDFSYNVLLKNDIDLTTADFPDASFYVDNGRKWHYINLFKSDARRIKIDYDHFRLCFYSEKEKKDFDTDPFQKNNPNIVERLWNNSNFREYLFRVFPSSQHIRAEGFYNTLGIELARFLKHRIFHSTPPLRDSVIRNFIITNISNGYFPNTLPDDDAMAVYESVLKNFRDYGQQISYERLDIEYQDFKNGNNFLPHIWDCYGYHKEWVFNWTVFFLAFFSVITFFFLPFLYTQVYKISFITIGDIGIASHKPLDNNKPADTLIIDKHQINKTTHSLLPKRLISRVWYSFIYTTLIFFQFTKAWDNLKFERKWKNVLGTLYVLVIWLTGIACIAYTAAFVLH